VGIERVGVVGAGLMGSGIAEVCARGGADVIVCETDAKTAAAGLQRIEESLARAVRGHKMDAAGSDAVLTRVAFTMDLFTNVDKILESDDAIISSNTSSIPIMKLAMATERPENVLGLHFFNPVPVQHLVELIPSIVTSEDAANRVEEFVAGRLDKRVIRSHDRAGFIVNFLFVPYVLSAIRMLESGFASAEDIDAGMVEGCSHPMGPLALADLIGLDTIKAVADSMYEEFKEPLYAAPPLLNRMVEAGLLGRKRGRGFFDYTK
jgi:3-hydroxybutyryl-CoA dehydrogenase